MKKLFTLLTLALISIGSAWGADVVVYSMTGITNGKTSADNGVVTSITATYVNGSAEVKNNHAQSKEVITSSGEVNINASGNNYFHAHLTGTGDNTIKAGDVIEFSSEGTAFVSTTASDTKPSSDAITFPYAVPEGSDLIGATDIYIYKGTISKFTSFTITRYSNVMKPEFSVEEGEFASTFDLTITCGTAGAAIEYSLDGGKTWNDYSTPIEISETTTVKAKATKTGIADSDIASATYTKVVVTEVFDAAGLNDVIVMLTKDNLTSTAMGYLSATSNVTWSSKTWSGYEGDYADLKTDKKITFKVKNANYIEVFVNGKADRTYTTKIGENDPVTCRQVTGSGFESSGVFATGTDEVSIVIEGGSSSVYPVYIKVNPTAPVSISSYEWATFCSDYALDFTGSDVKAYIVTGEEGSAITKQAVTTVAAGTPLLLNASEGDHNITIAAEGDDYSTTNKLQRGAGLAVSKPAEGSAWVLGVEGEKAVFQYIDGTPATVSTDKAYLLLESTTPTEARSLFLDDDVTGIKNIKVGSEDNIYYDLQGRRVLYPTKGLYIVNGKKVILK